MFYVLELYDPAIPLLGTDLTELEILIQKNMCTPMFTVVLFTNSQDLEAAQQSISE